MATWKNISIGGCGWVSDICIDVNNSNRYYINTDMTGCWYSEDGGDSWKKSQGILHEVGEEITQISSGKIFAATRGGLHVSTDNGVNFSWVQLPGHSYPQANSDSSLKRKNQVNCFGVAKSNNNIIYVGSGGPHVHREYDYYVSPQEFCVYKSTDGGVNWVKQDTGLDQTEVNGYKAHVSSISVHPTNPDIVFIATQNGLYKTTNGGSNWSKIVNKSNLCGVKILENDTNVIMYTKYGETLGVYRSTNGGSSWNKLTTSNGLESIDRYKKIKHDKDNLNNLFIISYKANGGHPKLWKSTDKGLNWTQVPDIDSSEWGPSKYHGYSFSSFVIKGNTYLTIPQGYKTSDAGQTWHTMWSENVDGQGEWGEWKTRGMEMLDCNIITSKPDNPNRLFMLSWDLALINSYNKGDTWFKDKPIVRDFPSHTGTSGFDAGHAIAFDPSNSNIVYAAFGKTSNGNEDLFKSTDGGETWNKINTIFHNYQIIEDIVVLDQKDSGSSHNTILCLLKKSTSQNAADQGIYRSTNGGSSWSLRKLKSYFRRLTKDPNNSSIVYAANQSYGLWKSTNAGKTWSEIGGGKLNYCFEVAVHPSNSNILVAVNNEWQDINNGGVWRSTNQGSTWTRVLGEGDPNNRKNYKTVVFDPNDGNTVYVGAQDGGSDFTKYTGYGVWKSTDTGQTWSKIPDDGLPTKSVQRLHITSNSDIIAGLWGGAALLSANPSPTATTSDASDIQSSSAQLNCVVNPNGDTTNYHFEYGTDTNYGSETNNKSAGNGNSNVYGNDVVADLTPNTTYHFRVVASNNNGTTYGDDKQFTTQSAGDPPTTTTNDATNVNVNTATLNATINPNGFDTSFYFKYAEDPTYANAQFTATKNIGSGTAPVNVSENISALSSDTEYYFKVIANNTIGESEGLDKQFTTLADGTYTNPPTAQTLSASNINQNDATINGRVNPNGLATSYYFEYGTDTNYGYVTETKDAGNGIVNIDVSELITDLEDDKTYHYRIVATNSNGTTIGLDESFATLAKPNETGLYRINLKRNLAVGAINFQLKFFYSDQEGTEEHVLLDFSPFSIGNDDISDIIYYPGNFKLKFKVNGDVSKWKKIYDDLFNTTVVVDAFNGNEHIWSGYIDKESISGNSFVKTLQFTTLDQFKRLEGYKPSDNPLGYDLNSWGKVIDIIRDILSSDQFNMFPYVNEVVYLGNMEARYDDNGTWVYRPFTEFYANYGYYFATNVTYENMLQLLKQILLNYNCIGYFGFDNKFYLVPRVAEQPDVITISRNMLNSYPTFTKIFKMRGMIAKLCDGTIGSYHEEIRGNVSEDNKRKVEKIIIEQPGGDWQVEGSGISGYSGVGIKLNGSIVFIDTNDNFRTKDKDGNYTDWKSLWEFPVNSTWDLIKDDRNKVKVKIEGDYKDIPIWKYYKIKGIDDIFRAARATYDFKKKEVTLSLRESNK